MPGNGNYVTLIIDIPILIANSDIPNPNTIQETEKPDRTVVVRQFALLLILEWKPQRIANTEPNFNPTSTASTSYPICTLYPIHTCHSTTCLESSSFCHFHPIIGISTIQYPLLQSDSTVLIISKRYLPMYVLLMYSLHVMSLKIK